MLICLLLKVPMALYKEPDVFVIFIINVLLNGSFCTLKLNSFIFESNFVDKKNLVIAFESSIWDAMTFKLYCLAVYCGAIAAYSLPDLDTNSTALLESSKLII
eukprot:NODE_121_length_17861_cov_0.498480.p18 type:complete len:103 gc:universal NODE_121_length_17861_cov_0.498480:7072-6764(-)